MSDSESERLALEQDMEDHAARQQTMPMPRQPPMPILPSSQAAVPGPAMAEVSAPAEPHPRVPEGPPTERLRTKTCVLPVLAQVGDPDPSEEDSSARRQVYLITFPHPRTAHALDGLPLLAPERFSRRDVLEALLGACRCPHYEDMKSRERQCQVTLDLASVFFELHKADEAGQAHPHAHVAVNSSAKFRFLPVKRALLQRHRLASHWSCTHDGYWSAV
jgi:hypothetical protein